MLVESLEALIVRELRAVKRELDAYPDDAAVWRPVPGVPNTAGTLALHVAGNLRHFVGAVLAGDGYVRDRDAEFARRDVSRAELHRELDAAIESVQRALRGPASAALRAPYPRPVADRKVHATTFALHLLAHLAYHLGQIDLHRRVATGNAAGVDAVSVRELPEVR